MVKYFPDPDKRTSQTFRERSTEISFVIYWNGTETLIFKRPCPSSPINRKEVRVENLIFWTQDIPFSFLIYFYFSVNLSLSLLNLENSLFCSHLFNILNVLLHRGNSCDPLGCVLPRFPAPSSEAGRVLWPRQNPVMCYLDAPEETSRRDSRGDIELREPVYANKALNIPQMRIFSCIFSLLFSLTELLGKRKYTTVAQS